MMYIRVKGGLPVEISDTGPGCGDHWLKLPITPASNGWIHSRDFKDYSQAWSMCAYLTAMTGKQYLPTDEGSGCYPRYRIIKAPEIGDEVSKGFNGDYYPVGKIAKITKTWQITTDQGNKFRRYKETSGWRAEGGTWWMISGVHEEQNPHF